MTLMNQDQNVSFAATMFFLHNHEKVNRLNSIRLQLGIGLLSVRVQVSERGSVN